MPAFTSNHRVRKPFVRACLCAAAAWLTLLAVRAQLPAPVSARPPAALALPPGPPTAPGEHIFQIHCAPCHGPGGEGGVGPTLAVPDLSRAPTDDDLVKVITNGIAGTEMPKARLSADEIKEVAAWVRQLGKIAPEKVPGNPAHGRELYFTRGGCVQCHTIDGHGGAIGPDLTSVGRRRGAAFLRRALVDPGADVPESYSAYRDDINLPANFLVVRVVTRDGREITGVRINEDTFSIQLRDLSGRVHSFLKSELAELHKDWGKSPMPAYGAVFTPAELDDVVAFLVSLRSQNP